jgi:hypothetical protein
MQPPRTLGPLLPACMPPHGPPLAPPLLLLLLPRPVFLLPPPISVTGESYAGHYVPAVSSAVYRANELGLGPLIIPLKGLAIGNGEPLDAAGCDLWMLQDVTGSDVREGEGRARGGSWG